MSWIKARTFRTLLTTFLVVSALALTSSLYAENQGRPGSRGRDDRDSKQVQRPANPRDSASGTDTRPAVQPSRSPDQGRMVQPAPVARPEQGRRGPGPQQARPGQQRAVPVDQGGSSVRPQPARDDRIFQRQQRAIPSKPYTAPEQRIAPQTPRQMQRPEPVVRDRARQVVSPRPVRQDNTPTQSERVDTERPLRSRDPNADAQRLPSVQNRDRRQSIQPLGGQAGQSRDRLRDVRPPAQERMREGLTNRPARETPVPQAKGRVQGVPEARFRGPEADRNVRIVRPEERQRVQQRLRDQLRERNRNASRPTRGRPTVDVVGNPISTDISVIVRDKASRIRVGYQRVRQSCGDPTFYYVFAPRSRADYWDGYWDGYTDGYAAGRHHFRGHRVAISFYYGYYWSDPFWFAFYYPGYYQAVYHYWGWSPGWVYPDRCYYAPSEYVYAPANPYGYYGGSYLDERGADRAINDIRRAWFDSDISTLAYHLTDNVDIRVYFDGEYSYSTTTEDYYAMTADAMATTQTISLDFDQPIWLSTHEFFVTAQHTFYDPNGDRQTVYISYRLRRLGGEWYVVSIGSSLEPIQHHYHDFRY